MSGGNHPAGKRGAYDAHPRHDKAAFHVSKRETLLPSTACACPGKPARGLRGGASAAAAMQRGRALPPCTAVHGVAARRANAPRGAVAAMSAARLRPQPPSACCPPQRAGVASAQPAALAALLRCAKLRWPAAAARRKRSTWCSASGAAQVRRGSCARFAPRKGRRLQG